MSTLDTILTRLQDGLGLTPAQAAGVAGNLQVESGFNPGAYNPREGAVGLGQWEGGREQNLRQFAQQRGTSENDLGTQVDFLIWELQGPESGALAQLRATNDPASAAAAFDQYYERSDGSARAKRVADAQAIASGNPSLAGVSASTTGTAAGSGSGSIASSIGGWMGLGGTFFTVGIKVLGAAAAAGLVIVGAVHTVSK